TQLLGEMHLPRPQVSLIRPSLGQWFELLFYESPFGNDRGYASSTVSGVRGYLELIPSAEHELTGLLDLIVPEVTPVTSSSPQLLDTLSSIECPAVLAVLDVGQGSANVMQNERCEPLLYFDVGRGVRADTATTQLPLEFCICGPRGTHPPVLISHWHEDHYEGANDDTDLYLCTWITPQALTLKHKSIQQNALNQGSTVLELLPGFPDFQFGATSNFTLTYCTGPATNLNHCGHALLVEREDKNWLLPADAAYKFICFAMDRAFTAVAATHHGAKFSGSAPLKAGGYARLVYSFGPDNSYKHPKTSSISKHTGKFWNHGFVGGWPAPIGALPPVPNGEVRSTAAHAPASLHLGSVVIGWNAPPPLAVPAYQSPGCGKSFNILQN
ncbi:hypothetical protein, partial [Xanthomonas arboricola]|uniref:hypothetical protein n=1 Tax=Xanthomonas arboricola TaxID=56448 RepID=UPI001C61504E